MRIVFAASEMSPLAQTGGLGDAIEGLPATLAARGHDVSICLPCYRGLREDPALDVRSTGVQLDVPVRDKRVPAEILECTAPNGVQLFLIRRDEYFDRPALYGADGRAYEDNAERFIFFSKAVVELGRRISPPPEIVHAHDWQTALIPVLVKDRRLPFRSVLTIHNLAYQGNFWAPDFGLLNLPGHYFTASGVEFYGQVNLLKGGILFADRVTTVSERYAREIASKRTSSTAFSTASITGFGTRRSILCCRKITAPRRSTAKRRAATRSSRRSSSIPRPPARSSRWSRGSRSKKASTSFSRSSTDCSHTMCASSFSAKVTPRSSASWASRAGGISGASRTIRLSTSRSRTSFTPAQICSSCHRTMSRAA